MKPLSIRSKQRGFTLIEVGIALTIGLVIIMGVARGIQAAQTKSAVAQVIRDLQYIYQGAAEYKTITGSYSGLTGLKDLACYGVVDLGAGSTLSCSDGNGSGESGTNLWGSKYTLGVTDDNDGIDITVPGVPTRALYRLDLQLNADPTADAKIDGNTVIVTYY